MSNSVTIDPAYLHKICRTCLRNIREYQGEQNTFTIEKRFSWSKLRMVEYKLWTYPRWMTKDAGVMTRLHELQDTAMGMLGKGKVQLSITTYTQLYRLLNKDPTFEPYVFGAGY